MIITRLRNLLIAVVCLLAGVEAKAQFSAVAEQYPTTDYSAAAYSFSLTEVATALGTDTITLATALKAYIAAEVPDPILFYAIVNNEEVAWTAATEADAHGFWLDGDGVPVGWGDNAKFYASPDVDANEDFFGFWCGQMPGKMAEGDVAHATIRLKFNEKVADFTLKLSVIAKPVFDIPEPATLVEKELNVVGQLEKVVEQYPRGGYDSDAVKISITDALAALGIDNREMVTESLDKLLFATVYNAGDVESGGGMKKDSVTNETTAGGIGWWMRPVQNENGEETGECSSANWGDTDRFFVEAFAFSAEGDTLSCNLGQYPGTCKDNEQYYTYIYIIYGDKAYRLNYTLKILEKEQGSGLADYTKVGEGSATTEQSPTDDYSTTQVKIDVEAIAAALGCEVSALGVYVLDDKDNFGGSTANNGGWWLNSAGTVTSWGTGAAFFIEPPTANDWSVVNVGQYPNALNVGDEVSGTLNFVNGTSYYPFTITLKIVEAQHSEQNFESVATRTFALQSLLYNDYTALDLVTIAAEEIEAAIGTTTPTLYGLAIDSVAAQTGEIYSKKWSCDPKPGFWLNKDGRVSVWGDADARVGISWVDNSVLRFFQFPNRNSIGDVFATQLFLVNEETNKMITLNINLSFVESVVEKEVVGSENIILPISTKEQKIVINVAKAAEALEVTTDELLSTNNYYLRGMKSDGSYGEGQNCENGLSFAMDGGYDGYGDIYFSIEKDGENVVINIASNNAVADDWNVSGQFCFEVGDKQFVYYFKFVSEAWYVTGISDASRLMNNDERIKDVYDLSGRKVEKTTRGFYIQDGKKFIVK